MHDPLGHKTFFYFDYVMTEEDKAICMRIETPVGESSYYFRDETKNWRPISKDIFHRLMRPEEKA